jgi:hypothetical protein
MRQRVLTEEYEVELIYVRPMKYLRFVIAPLFLIIAFLELRKVIVALRSGEIDHSKGYSTGVFLVPWVSRRFTRFEDPRHYWLGIFITFLSSVLFTFGGFFIFLVFDNAA